MTTKLETLELALKNALGEGAQISSALGELTVVVKAADYIRSMTALRDTPALAFEQMIDLCGVDYSEYGEGTYEGPRFAVVVHLLSLTHNWRVRVRVFCPDDDMPLVLLVVPAVSVVLQAARAKAIMPPSSTVWIDFIALLLDWSVSASCELIMSREIGTSRQYV